MFKYQQSALAYIQNFRCDRNSPPLLSWEILRHAFCCFSTMHVVHMASSYAMLLVAGAAMAAFLYSHYQRRSALSRTPARCPVTEKRNTADPSWGGSNSNARAEEEAKKKAETKSYKKLYYQVQNLEKFPDSIPFARQTLLSLLRQANLEMASWIGTIATSTESCVVRLDTSSPVKTMSTSSTLDTG